MIIPTFKCPYCDKESTPTMDMTGEMPVGMMVACDCSESRKAWETQHRAEVERRKNARRNSLTQVGRTTPAHKAKHRSR